MLIMKAFTHLVAVSLIALGSAIAVEPTVASLEAKLSQTVDTTPEGAAALLALIDLHRAQALIPGLTRHAKRFTDAHVSHARHAEVLAMLVQGLRISSRHAELIAASRQFLERYPNDARQLEISQSLQESLALTNRKREAADAAYAAWQRV